jgi:hypothetical protein
MIAATPLWAWGLPFLFGSPWIVGSIVLWRMRPRDGFVPPSFAERSRWR